MALSAFEWSLIGGAASLAIALITYFLKRTMSRVDQHEKDINHIKLTYVTKKDLEKMEGELKSQIQKLNESISEIKDNFLPKEDYFRTSVETSRKLDAIQGLIIERLGGGNYGKP